MQHEFKASKIRDDVRVMGGAFLRNGKSCGTRAASEMSEETPETWVKLFQVWTDDGSAAGF